MTDLCAAYGVSRKTGYKLVNRFAEEHTEALFDLSRAPHTHPNETPAEIEGRIVKVRQKYGWGGRKIVDYLSRRMDADKLPARSTVDAILKRRGLVKPRRRRRPRVDVQTNREVTAPNDQWGTDFKGWFRTGDGQRCDPFTLTDSYSRFLFRCDSAAGYRCEHVKPYFERAFRKYGLPWSIRSDNGPPFATTGIAGLSQLSIWFIRLGVYPDLIPPGRPQQNGRHERMHRTLKQETARPPKATLRAQQRAFNGFRNMYNNERPHEGIDGRVPSDVYEPSPRPYPSRLPELEYPDTFYVRKVQKNGVIKVDGELFFLGAALRGQYVGLEPEAGPLLTVRFGPYAIATINPPENKVLTYRKCRP